MLEQIVHLDQELFLFLNGLGTETWDGFWMFMTRTRNSAPLYALLLYLVYKNFGNQKNHYCSGGHCIVDYLHRPTLQFL